MKKGIFLPSLIGLLALSCTVQEIETQNHPYEPAPEDDVFYASLAPESDTKVYVDEHVKTLWDENDQISIFNNSTQNLKYEFMGKTGDNAGYFKRVTEESGTRAESDKLVCAVYPYQESTTLDDSGVLTLTLPKKQTYRENSYGLGANTMVSTTDGKNNLLRFKNVGGYLVLKFYGSGVTVKSIKLEGRNGERLSGEATMTPVIGELPIIEMAETAGTSITLDANKTKLEKKAEDAIEFWMVVPPTVFTEGFLLTVTDKDGKVFTKETDQRLEIERNTVLRIKAIEVKPEDPVDPNQVIYYTTSDKSVVVPAEGADFGASYDSEKSKYLDLKGIMVFNGNVTQIGDRAFEGCDNLTGMTLPSTVTSIGEYAFAGCSSLGAPNTPSGSDITEPAKGPNRSGETTFVIPDGVTSIGAYAFKDCESLTSVIIPDSVTSIGDGAFEGCINLTDINIPDSVEDLGENVFNGCSGITSVTIPYGVTSIDAYAFAECTNLTEIIIPDTVTSIGEHAFYMCSNLLEVIIPDSVTSIGESAFEDCEELVSINIPVGITKIENGTFAACMSLPSIEIPNTVTWIGNSAFESCFKLANVTLPSSVTYIGNGAFASCESFTSFDIPANVTTIYGGTFNGCDNLASVNIPEGVTGIAFWAFADCPSLSEITIPSTVTSIEDQAFLDCPGLTSITVLATVPPVDVSERTFENTNNCPIYVPAESLAAYKNAEGWSNYASRIHTIGSADGMIQGHAYVDMGTGLKWATMNVGAATESDPGERYNWTAGIAAVEEWGGSWRLPTKEELDILIDENKFTWTWDSTNYGCWVESLIAGFEGNRIFLPANGLYDPTDPDWNIARTGFYWSSTFESDPFYLEFDIDDEASPLLVGAFDYNIQISLRPVAD